MKMSDLVIFIDNEKYRNKGVQTMNNIETDKYFSFLDDEDKLWSLTVKKIKELTQKEVEHYFSFLDNEQELSQYIPHILPKKKAVSTPKTIVKPMNNVKPIQTVVEQKTNSVVDIYMNIAKTQYEEIFKKDDGMLFRIYFQKLVPLETNSVLNWAGNEMNLSAEYTNEVSKLTFNYRSLKAYDILQKIITDINQKPSFWKKIRGYETQLTQARLSLTTIRERIEQILTVAIPLIEKLEKNANRLNLFSGCISIVAQCAEEENQTGGVYQYLYSRRDTLFSSTMQANLLMAQLKGIIDEVNNMIIQIDETIHVVIPNVELARANDV